MNARLRMSRPQSRVGFGRGREVSGTARHNILANVFRVGQKKFGVKVIRHIKCESFPQGLRAPSKPVNHQGHEGTRRFLRISFVYLRVLRGGWFGRLGATYVIDLTSSILPTVYNPQSGTLPQFSL